MAFSIGREVAESTLNLNETNHLIDCLKQTIVKRGNLFFRDVNGRLEVRVVENFKFVYRRMGFEKASNPEDLADKIHRLLRQNELHEVSPFFYSQVLGEAPGGNSRGDRGDQLYRTLNRLHISLETLHEQNEYDPHYKVFKGYAKSLNHQFDMLCTSARGDRGNGGVGNVSYRYTPKLRPETSPPARSRELIFILFDRSLSGGMGMTTPTAEEKQQYSEY